VRAPSDLVPVADPSVGDWIEPRFAADFGSVGATVPLGYAAYARVLHPVDRAEGRPHLTWAEVCAITCRIPHPVMQWHSIKQGAEGPWEDGEPFEGNLDPATLATLLDVLAPATGDQDCFHALWDGWGWLHPGAVAVVAAHDGDDDGDGPPPTIEPGLPPEVLALPRLRLPHREYLVFRGPLRAASALGWDSPVFGFDPQSPSLLWPADRSWCVATEIDFDSTLVAGDEDLVAAVLAAPGLEAWPVTPADRLTYASDLLNGGPPIPR
jgi:hypothetical protein